MRIQFGWLPLATMILLVGCGPQPVSERIPTGETVLAWVNDVPITDRMVTYHLRGTHAEKLTEGAKARALESLIEAELITQYGLSQGLDRSKRYQELVRRLELELAATRHNEMLRRVYGELIATSVEVSPDEVRSYFDGNKERFGRHLHLGSLQFDDRASAEQALAEIRAGGAFDQVAAARAGELPDASKKPWDLGMLVWTRIPFEWHDLVYKLQPGEVSEVFEGRGTGIRLFTLYGTEEAGPVDFVEVRNAIGNRLREQRENLEFRQLLQRLRQQAEVRTPP